MMFKNILQRFAKSAQTSSLSSPHDWLIAALAGGNTSVTSVSPEGALRVAAYIGCLRVVAEDIAALPVRVFKDDGGNLENIKDHPAYRLLAKAPNALTIPQSFKEFLVHSAMAYGNGYAEIRHDSTGRPIALHPIHPSFVSVEVDEDGNLGYIVRTKNKERVLLSDEILHVRGLGDSIQGWPLAKYMGETLGLARSLERTSAALFANACQPSGILMIPPGLSDDARGRLRKQFEERHAGSQNKGRLAILESTFDFKSLAITPEDAQTIQQKDQITLEICRFFRVPPSKVGYVQGLNYSVLESINLSYANETLVPWARRLEQECEAKLLTEAEQRTVSIRLDFRGLLRTTHAQRAAYYNVMRGIGAMSANEVRVLEDLSRRDDEYGDSYQHPLNMTHANENGLLLEDQTNAST